MQSTYAPRLHLEIHRPLFGTAIYSYLLVRVQKAWSGYYFFYFSMKKKAVNALPN